MWSWAVAIFALYEKDFHNTFFILDEPFFWQTEQDNVDTHMLHNRFLQNILLVNIPLTYENISSISHNIFIYVNELNFLANSFLEIFLFEVAEIFIIRYIS